MKFYGPNHLIINVNVLDYICVQIQSYFLINALYFSVKHIFFFVEHA